MIAVSTGRAGCQAVSMIRRRSCSLRTPAKSEFWRRSQAWPNFLNMKPLLVAAGVALGAVALSGGSRADPAPRPARHPWVRSLESVIWDEIRVEWRSGLAGR